MRRLLALFVLFLLGACSESFVPAWAVTDLRVVGARAEVDGDLGRARPDPGDGLRVSLRVIDQGAPPSDILEVPALTPALLRWSFVACVPEPVLIGPPICRDPIEPCDGCDGNPPADPLAFPVMAFQVPPEATLEAAGASSVALQGVVCIHGVPSADAIARFLLGESENLEPCEPDPDREPRPDAPPPEGRFVLAEIPIETTPEDPNLHPEIADVRLNGRPWPPPYHEDVPRTAPRTGCKGDLETLTEEERQRHPVADGATSTINLSVSPESFQSYSVDDVTLIEEMQVSWLADGGDLERTFSFITSPATSVLTSWRPFQNPDEDGTLVRFNFVIRDGRGGTDWFERGLCVLPAPPIGSPP